MPFCHVTLKVEKPPAYELPKTPRTWGEHVRRRRLGLGLLQKDVAREVGVDKTTVYNWETGRVTPAVRSIPGVIRFLGYAPYDPTAPFGEKLRVSRQALGLSQEGLARALGVDESTVVRWESGKGKPSGKFLAILGAFFRR